MSSRFGKQLFCASSPQQTPLGPGLWVARRRASAYSPDRPSPAWHFQVPRTRRAPWDGTGRRPQGGGVKNRVRSSPGPLAGAHSSVTVKRPPASVGGGPSRGSAGGAGPGPLEP
jgi:hypothetical protein